MARCLHDGHTRNCGSNIGFPDTIQGGNFVSQLGQLVNLKKKVLKFQKNSVEA